MEKEKQIKEEETQNCLINNHIYNIAVCPIQLLICLIVQVPHTPARRWIKCSMKMEKAMKTKQTVAKAQVGVSCKERETPPSAAMLKSDEENQKPKVDCYMEKCNRDEDDIFKLSKDPKTRATKSVQLVAK